MKTHENLTVAKWLSLGEAGLRQKNPTVSAVLFAAISIAGIGPLSAETPADPPPKLPIVAPADAGLDAEHLQRIDAVVSEGLAAKQMPGCVVAIGRRGSLAFLKAYGHRQLEPSAVAMTTDTVFDLASLTKPIATATSAMILVERGRIDPAKAAARYLPALAPHGKDHITVEQLLIHQSGLLADNSLKDYQGSREESLRRIFELKLTAEPGSRFIYSDVGFIVLGELVAEVSGKPLNEFCQAEIFAPLGMSETGFLPLQPLRDRAAPTERRDDRWLQGEVHDPRAARLGGVAGHAGLFSTAEDLAVYAQMLLNGGEYGGQRILKPETIERMTRAYPVSSGQRGLGWDKRTGYSINRGIGLSQQAFGHGGFTGTALWIDPDHDLFVIFLSNRLHPDGQGNVNRLASRIGTIAVAVVVGEGE